MGFFPAGMGPALREVTEAFMQQEINDEEPWIQKRASGGRLECVFVNGVG
jgi:hypothetical protein